MVNPFEKRATEYLREDEAFLAMVAPEPLITFFREPAEDGSLYDRLAVIIGTPGSGKTTLALLFQYSNLKTLLRNHSATSYKPLVDSLTACGALVDEQPVMVACRLPLESEYREIWDLPYTEELKSGLLVTLLQARAVLGWIRMLQAGGHVLSDISIEPRTDAVAATNMIGGIDGQSLFDRACVIEDAIYRITAALIAPSVDALPTEAISAYRPLDAIASFKVREGERETILRPLVIFDDAHSLHPSQLLHLRRWLARRELKISRWILTRLDAMMPGDALGCEAAADEGPGLDTLRDIKEIRLQGHDERRIQRVAFRKMAKDMASRYLSQMDIFRRRRLTSLGDMLGTVPETIAPGKMKELTDAVEAKQRKLKIADARRKELEDSTDQYLNKTSSTDRGEDIRLAMISILLNRYAKRAPGLGLFDEFLEVDPAQSPTADAGVADGAKIHLLHQFNRPYYFGIDALCDASSENAEIFLKLASAIVTRLETQLVRNRGGSLTSGNQHAILRERAIQLIDAWEFPLQREVKRLADRIGERCVQRSLEGNASLGGGASAFGILQEDFNKLPQRFPQLARVLQFGVAYNAFTLVPNHSTKKKTWCLIELGGLVLLKHGLTLKRGGFIESKPTELLAMLEEK